MKQTMRLILVLMLLVCSMTAWADDRVYIVAPTNGTVSVDNANPTGAATVTLTVTPTAGQYYITLGDIKVEKTASTAQTRTDGPAIVGTIAVAEATVDDTGKGTYTFDLPDGYGAKVTATFTECATFTPTISITDWTYGSAANDPEVTGNTSSGTETITYSIKDANSYSATVPTAANDYTVKVSIAAKGHYKAAEATTNFTIAKKDITISGIKAKNKEYDGGTTATLDYTSVVYGGIEDGDALTVSTTGTFEDASLGEGKTVTLGTLTLGGTSVSNYQLATTGQQTSTTANITQAVLKAETLNSKITLSSTSIGYTGEPVAPTVTIDGMTEGTDYDVKYKNGTEEATATKPTNYGTYTIVIVGMGNYKGEVVTSKTFQITKAAAAVTTAPTAIEDLVYNGSNQALINNDGVAANGTLHYSLDGTSYSTTIPTGKDAKAYTVYYKVVGDANHTDTDPVTISVSIAKKDITISGIKAKNKEYDGGTTAILDYTSVDFGGIEDGDALTVSTTGTFEDAKVGEGKTVTLGTLTMGGTSVVNYQLAATGQQTTTTADITQAVLNTATLNSKITLSSTSLGYTGEPVAPTVTIDGMTEGTDYDVKYKNGDAEATATKPTDNGTYTIVIMGKGNYTGEVVTSKTFQITKAAAAVATAPTAKTGLVENGELQELITAGSGTNGTMQYSLDNKTYSTAIPKGKDAGTYTVYYKVVGNTNYADTEAKTLTVTIAEPKPQIIDESKPMTFEGETYYELLSDVVNAIDDNIKLTIALPATADSRTTVSSSGSLVFSKGSDINIIIRNVKKSYLLRIDFTGRILCNGSLLWRVARSRGSVDEELLSDQDYEVIVTGDMMLTLKLADKETVLRSITLKSPSTAIEAIEGDEGTDQWYDLNGRRISQPTRKGIYIRNGKKVVR